MKRSPSLDGIRGVAILAVMALHASYGRYAGGFLGVEAFFVLSGYLITMLLMREHSTTGAVSLVHFYARRALRLLPALTLTIVLVIALNGITRNRYAGADYPQSLLFGALYVGNWVESLRGDSLGLLGHSWSLGVEEQFYIVWPCLLLLLLRLGIRNQLLTWMCLALAASGAATTAGVFLFTRSTYVYFATYTHGAGLLIGCALACHLCSGREFHRLANPLLAGAALAGLGVMSMFLPATSPLTYLGGFLLADLLTAVLIIQVVSSPAGGIAGLLARSTISGIGRISYGLYLYHFPVFAAGEALRIRKNWLNFVQVRTSEVLVVFLIAIASFLLVERRFLKISTNMHNPPRPREDVKLDEQGSQPIGQRQLISGGDIPEITAGPTGR